MDDYEEDIVYFKKELILARRRGDKKRINIIKKRLRQMEDALVIYRLSRSPERQLFTIYWK